MHEIGRKKFPLNGPAARVSKAVPPVTARFIPREAATLSLGIERRRS